MVQQLGRLLLVYLGAVLGQQHQGVSPYWLAVLVLLGLFPLVMLAGGWWVAQPEANCRSD